MTTALRQLGFAIEVQPDEKEFCNRTICVGGLGGRIPNGGTAEKPVGLVYLAALRQDGEVRTKELRLGDIGRGEVRLRTVAEALSLLQTLI